MPARLSYHPAQLAGSGNATGLRCPSRSTARTPKCTLSLEMSIVAEVTVADRDHVGPVRLRSSRATRPRSRPGPARCRGCQRSVVSLVSCVVSMTTPRGARRRLASDQRAAAFTRATRAM